MYSYGPPHMAVQKQDDQHEHTFSSYVRIRDVVLKTCLGRWTIGRSGERGSGISMLAAWHDDDDEVHFIIIHEITLFFLSLPFHSFSFISFFFPYILSKIDDVLHYYSLSLSLSFSLYLPILLSSFLTFYQK